MPTAQGCFGVAMGSSAMVSQRVEQSQLLVQHPDAPSPAQPQVWCIFTLQLSSVNFIYTTNAFCVCQGAIFHFAVALRSKHLCLLCPAVFRCHPLSPPEVAGGGQLMTTLMRGGSASWSGTGQQLLVADRNARYGSALWRRRLKNSAPSTSRCRLVCANDFLTFFKSKMWMSTDLLQFEKYVTWFLCVLSNFDRMYISECNA